MVLPEIRHHLLELPLARDGTRQLHRLHVADDSASSAKLFAELRVVAHGVGAHLAPVGRGVALARGLSRALADRLLARLRERHELARVGVIRLERRRDQRIGGCILHAVRGELQRDPLVDAHRADTRDVAWPGTEPQPVERVADLLIRRLLARLRRGHDDQPHRRPGRRGVVRAGTRRHARDADGQQ